MILEHFRNQFERDHFTSHSVLISMLHKTTHVDVTRIHIYKLYMLYSKSPVEMHPIYHYWRTCLLCKGLCVAANFEYMRNTKCCCRCSQNSSFLKPASQQVNNCRQHFFFVFFANSESISGHTGLKHLSVLSEIIKLKLKLLQDFYVVTAMAILFLGN